MVHKLRLLAVAALALCAVAATPTAAFAEPKFTEIATIAVHSCGEGVDSNSAVPDSRYYVRNERGIYYLPDQAHQDAIKDTKSYDDDKQPGVVLAFAGLDPVAWWPYGVHHPATGALVFGKAKYLVYHHGAPVALSNEPNYRAFVANPDKYIPWVGGWCVGYLAKDGLSPAYPGNDVWVAELNNHMTFGGGPPDKYRALPAAEQVEIAMKAKANYDRRMREMQATAKVAALH